MILRALAFLAAFASNAQAASLDLPLSCRMGETCAVQNWPDYESGPERRDPACGQLTYNGHDGIDIRVPARAFHAGAPVLAPAAATVIGVRDGEPDGSFLQGGAAAVRDRECGNGVRLRLDDGRALQLCHMRRGSVAVRAGERVSAGRKLGLVGLSGKSAFPHVHIALESESGRIDPLTGDQFGARSCSAGAPLAPGAHWSESARAALAYRGAALFDHGFSDRAPTGADDPDAALYVAHPSGDALIFWARAIGPKTGDVIRVRIRAPDGAIFAEGERVQPREQVSAMAFAGRKRTSPRWAPGRYEAEATLVRGGKVLDRRIEALVLR